MNRLANVEQEKLALRMELDDHVAASLSAAVMMNTAEDLARSFESIFLDVHKNFSQALIQTAVAISARSCVEAVLKSEQKRVVDLEIELEERRAEAIKSTEELPKLSAQVTVLTDENTLLTRQVGNTKPTHSNHGTQN